MEEKDRHASYMEAFEGIGYTLGALAAISHQQAEAMKTLCTAIEMTCEEKPLLLKQAQLAYQMAMITQRMLDEVKGKLRGVVQK